MQFMPQRTKFGEHTPPAIFPNMMGLFGLGLAWGHAERAFDLPPMFSQLLLGAVTLLYLFALVSYLRKLTRRAGTLIEDLKVLPGRAGVTAMVLSGYLLAASLVPVNADLGFVVMLVTGVTHLGLVALVIWLLATGPAEQRQVTPVWHLVFVGFVLAPLTAIPLGYEAASTVILYVTGAITVFIWAVSARQLATHTPPAPLRPLLAIHLAPAAVVGMVATLLGLEWVALGLAGIAIAILVTLLAFARTITESGFSALWGAFTFPMAAFANFMFVLDKTDAGAAFAPLGIAALVGSSAAIPLIATKVLQAWAKGQLAAKTNAARA